MKDIFVTREIYFKREQKGRTVIKEGKRKPTKEKSGRVPRITRLMALAIRFEKLIKEGAVKDQAEIARLGHVSRARVTQIMNLNFLAPDIQEDILLLPKTRKGRDPIRERHIRPIVLQIDWVQQRKLWNMISALKRVNGR